MEEPIGHVLKRTEVTEFQVQIYVTLSNQLLAAWSINSHIYPSYHSRNKILYFYFVSMYMIS